MRYFKKQGPRTPLMMPNGDARLFPTLDGKWGWEATDDPVIIAGYELAIKNRCGGISETTQAEYEAEYVKKNTSSTPFAWPTERECFQPGIAPDTMMPRVVPAAESARVEDSKIVSIDSGAGDVKPKKPAERPIGKRPRIEP
jgi:hypothetical protein